MQLVYIDSKSSPRPLCSLFISGSDGSTLYSDPVYIIISTNKPTIRGQLRLT